jgi:AcrR family transcriptional regulator
MARPQALDYAAKHAHIARVAAACFASAGYPSTSMTDIARASGVSKAGLYHYYPSKDAVLHGVLSDYVESLLALAQQAVLPPADVPSAALASSTRLTLQHTPQPSTEQSAHQQALYQLIQALLRTYATAHHQHRVLVSDTHYLSAAPRQQVLTTQRKLVALMARTLQAAYPERITPQSASAHAMMVFGMLNWTFTWLKTDGALSYADYAQQVITTLDQGLSTR